VQKLHPDSQIYVVCGFSKQKDMTSMLHKIATCPKVAAIYPVTSQHFKLSHIDNVKEKVEEISRLLHPYINEKNPF
jgi:folylpolyglutamate synthase/dihydropteroate synthase